MKIIVLRIDNRVFYIRLENNQSLSTLSKKPCIKQCWDNISDSYGYPH